MKKERGIRVVEYGSPTKSSKQGIKTCRGEETVGKAEGSKAGFQLQNTEAPKMFRKGLPGEGERKSNGLHKKLNATTKNRFAEGKAKGIREKNRFLLCRNTGSKIVYFAQILCVLNFFVPWGSTGKTKR